MCRLELLQVRFCRSRPPAPQARVSRRRKSGALVTRSLFIGVPSIYLDEPVIALGAWRDRIGDRDLVAGGKISCGERSPAWCGEVVLEFDPVSMAGPGLEGHRNRAGRRHHEAGE